MERVNKMFSDRYEILEQLEKLITSWKKYENTDSKIISDLQNVVDGINANIEEEAFAYEQYQDAMMVTNG
jgi:hypothetical protein